MSKDQDLDLFETSDIGLAAYLDLSIKIFDIKPLTPTRSTFRFENSQKLKDLTWQYYSGKGTASALDLFNNIRKIKVMSKNV